MPRKRSRQFIYYPPGEALDTTVSFVVEEELIMDDELDTYGETVKKTFKEVSGGARILEGNKSQSGFYDPFNPFRYLADLIEITKGYRSAFEQGEFIVAAFTFGPQNFTLNGDIDTKTLKEAFDNVPSKAAQKLRAQILKGKYKGNRNKVLTPRDLYLILTSIEEVLASDGFKNKMIETAQNLYRNTVLPVIKQNTPDSLRRGGGGGQNRSFNEETQQEDEGDSGGKRKRQKFWSKSGNKSTYFTRYWNAVKQILTQDVRVDTFSAKTGTNVAAGITIAPFSAKDLLAIRISGTRSRFNSMYLMAEFGTGVRATFPRPYKSLKATPFKLSPPLAALFQKAGVNANPFSWSSNLGVLHRLGNYPKTTRESSTVLGDVSSVYSQRNRRKGATNRQKQLDRYFRLLNRYSSYIFGKEGPTSVPPSGILFDKRGIVKNIRTAYKDYLKGLGKLLEFDIEARVRQKITAKGTYTIVNGKKVYVSDVAKSAATLSKFLKKGFIQFKLPDSIFDVVNYKEIYDAVRQAR